jgi:hypothetical protein
MGTSTAYTPSPKWSGTKTELTNALNSGNVEGQQAKNILGGFVQQLAGDKDDGFGNVPTGFGHIETDKATEKLEVLLQKLPPCPTSFKRMGVSDPSQERVRSGSARSWQRSSGPRGGGRAARAKGGTVVRPAAQRLAQFISEVPKVGLRQALKNTGLVDVEKMQLEEIALAVADCIAADASQLIMTELRDAVATVVEKLCDKAQTLVQAEQKIIESAGRLESVVQNLFECYIMERFKTFFCEHESPKHGYEAADKILNEAREFVASEMDILRADKHDLTNIDWTGVEGEKIVDAILERTIAVYTN